MNHRAGKHVKRGEPGVFGFFIMMGIVTLCTLAMAISSWAQLEREMALEQGEETAPAPARMIGPERQRESKEENTQYEEMMPQDSGAIQWWMEYRGQEATPVAAQPAELGTGQAEEHKTSLGTFVATAYCACPDCCGKWANGITYSGAVATEGRTVAVDPDVIPLGSKVYINGHEYIAEDIGGSIDGKRLDIFYDSHEDALAWGRKKVEVYIVG